MNNVMIDLETMSTKPNAAIVSIGAVVFDTEITDEFYKIVDLESCERYGMSINADTVLWWLKQSEPARCIFKQGCQGIWESLRAFSDWVPNKSLMWGNGAGFDNVILRNAYEVTGIDCPWKYYNDRCYRTIKAMCPDIKMKRTGIHHNALDDAISQAEHLMEIWRSEA